MDYNFTTWTQRRLAATIQWSYSAALRAQAQAELDRRARAAVLRAYLDALAYDPSQLCTTPAFALATASNDPELAKAAAERRY